MKIVVFNGCPEGYNQFENKLEKYLDDLQKQNPDIKTFTLRNMNLSYCTGCFNCWWKTPGLCNIKDDIQPLSQAFINYDRVVFASPLIHGHPSALLKKVQDRLIPLLMPYMILSNKEIHHKKRYGKYPLLELFFGDEKNTDPTDHQILTDIYRRFTLNFHSSLVKTQFIPAQ